MYTHGRINLKVVKDMSIQADLQKIRKEKLAPCYLILGTEKYLQDQVRA